MNIRNVQPPEIEAVRQFLAAHGWAHRVGDPEFFAKLIRNSQRAVVVLESSQVIGFARAITDGLSNGYLSMVTVAPEHRRKGIGRALVGYITGGAPTVTWVLRADRPGAEAFFTRSGSALLLLPWSEGASKVTPNPSIERSPPARRLGREAHRIMLRLAGQATPPAAAAHVKR